MTQPDPVADLRAAATRLRNTLDPSDVTITLAYLLGEVADSVEMDDGIIQDSTSDAALQVARAILGSQP
ncbi:hypothetical protein BX265_6152 [Streptomyces sp. TLI_235]|nr:hypothetical protein [Streptomyces sp. TLI_235]PBC71542.1 hypothetical protein BX265_6152 [Streptomyces sp. TLI_235]